MSFQTDLPCAATGRIDVQRCLHHVYTRKARPDLIDEEWNLLPLTLEKHTETHQIGMNRFVEKYPRIRIWLLDKGWRYDAFLNKWINEKAFK